MTFFVISLMLLIFLFVIYSLLVFYFLYKRCIVKANLRDKYNLSFDTKICAFFHPSCNGGGGGERVLWEAIQIIQNKYSKIFCVIYCTNIDSKDDSILENINSLFGIRIEKPVHFVRLKYCRFLEPTKYKRFTMVGQSMGSVIVALEALFTCVPHIYFDTVGYAFTFPIFKLLGLCKTVAYVHYPTISSDMLQSVSNREACVNNDNQIRNSEFLTFMKLHYYRSFALFYLLVSKTIDFVMVNSSWTKAHIVSIWRRDVNVVYPPCDTEKIRMHLTTLTPSEIRIRKKPWIISVGQFRPEKNHLLQLEAFKLFIDQYKSNIHQSYLNDDEETGAKLIIIGGCRSADDRARVKALQAKCLELNIQNYVRFKCNIKYEEMLNCFAEGSVGLHTMKNEHFGIAIVESMAAGLVTVAHKSGGPKLDIIDNGINGFLASTAEEYAKIFDKIFSRPFGHWAALRDEAKLKSSTFNNQKFCALFSACVEDLFV